MQYTFNEKIEGRKNYLRIFEATALEKCIIYPDIKWTINQRLKKGKPVLCERQKL